MPLKSLSLTLVLATTLIVSSGTRAFSQEQSFDFKDPKKVNNASFILDSELEPIMGYASGISGTVRFDPKKPKAIQGKIVVDAKSIKTPNDRMNSKLHGGEWLNVEKNTEVTFEVKKVKKVEKGKKDGEYKMTVIGAFTLCGVTKDIEVPVLLNYLPGKMKARMRRDGDLLVLRSQFVIKRSEFKCGPAMPVVADEMQIRIAIVGGDPK